MLLLIGESEGKPISDEFLFLCRFRDAGGGIQYGTEV